MKKVIAIFGAGTGLSSSVAKQYGKKGYQVVLVARNQEKLDKLTNLIAQEGIEVFNFTADLSKADHSQKVVAEIIEKLGTIDSFYYAPNPQDSFTPAQALTKSLLEPKFELYFYGLINIIQQIVPIYKEKGEGEILSAIGGTAAQGIAFMSGLGPVMAASRNYLQSLQQELLQDHIHIGIVTINAIIQNSETYNQVLTYNEDIQYPLADPDVLAELLIKTVNDDNRLEVFYP
ncbi:SDR family NAD(P)-dependent oxidoreductase [Acinetobacter sp. 194]|uniref:SDR family NAD(P)-dependent oxidoreductase n=1 Tax=Acinetobacter shaoyimingii TaxID=2715164 RepID=UPI00140885D0|nr:SDR family NAD(P)-dependent oxidoreductase [Acinetobacter shaoyimingii]NHB57836.1 SDR family NAD(P)-dependent oxidoreductase [Acinetobacter shaoyimingii]